MSTVVKEEENYLRMVFMMFRLAPPCVRRIFDREFSPVCLQQTINKFYPDLKTLRSSNRLTQAQWDLLFPIPGTTTVTSNTFDITLMLCLIRNIASIQINDHLPIHNHTTEVDDLSRIKFYRNKFVHSDKGLLSETDFETQWTDLSQAFGRLGGTSATDECDRLKTSRLDTHDREMLTRFVSLEKHVEELYNSVPMDLPGMCMEILETWKETAAHKVETSITRQIQSKMEFEPCVIIDCSRMYKYNPGMDTIKEHVAVYMNQKHNYTVLPIQDVLELKHCYNSRVRQLFILDETNTKMLKKLEKMKPFITAILQSKAKLLIMAKNYYCCDNFLEQHLFKINQCTLTAEDTFLLNANEYLSRKDIEQYNIFERFQEIDFFPVIIKLYSKSKTVTSITDFFIEPCKIIERELEKMRDTENLAYFCLALCVMNNNNVKMIENIVPTLKRLCDAQNTNFNRTPIRSCFNSLEGNFLKQKTEDKGKDYSGTCSDKYEFYSERLFIVVAHYFLEHMFDLVLNEGCSDFVSSRFRFRSNYNETDNKYFVVPSDKEELYFQKLLDDLNKGNPNTAFWNENLRDQSYFEKFNRYFLLHADIVKQAIFELKRQVVHPFHIVAAQDFCLVVPLLLDLNLDINIQDTFGATPIFFAVLLKKYSMVNILLRNGANPNICPTSFRCDIANDDIMPPLCLAAREGDIDVVKCILENKADLNIASRPLQWTALCFASSNGHNAIVKLLIDSNCDPNIFDSNNCTPLYMACEGDYIDVVKTLLEENVNPNTRDTYRRNKRFTCWNPYVELDNKRSRTARYSTDGYSPLLNAIKHGNVQMVELLLNHKADPNMSNRYHVSPLHAAITFRKGSNFKDKYLDIARMLLEQGANPNTFDVDCTSPFSTAVYNKDDEAINILLQTGADTNFDNRFRRYAPYIFQENLHFRTRVLDIMNLKEYSCRYICWALCSLFCCRCKQKPDLLGIHEVSGQLIERA